jgi:hypothetical protein
MMRTLLLGLLLVGVAGAMGCSSWCGCRLKPNDVPLQQAVPEKVG